LGSLISEGFVNRAGEALIVTEKGMHEKDRLVTLAGLMVEKETNRQSSA
jgi:hypothetical protein